MVPLITHRIGAEVCLERQRAHYHKCHRCLYRGQAADYEVAPPASLTPQRQLTAVQRNGAMGQEPTPAVAREETPLVTDPPGTPEVRPRGAKGRKRKTPRAKAKGKSGTPA